MIAEISSAITGEWMLFLISLIQGLVFMAVYDILRIFRKMVRHGAVWLAFEDVIYWTFCSLGIFAMLYQENEGAMRWFVFAGVALGMLMENHFVSPWVIRFSVLVLRFFGKILSKIGNIVAKPCKRIKHRGGKILSFLKKWLKKLAKAIRMGLCKL